MALIKEIDYGTKASKSEEMVTLSIDGVEVTVPAGTSIMRAAMEIGTTHPEALRHRHARQLRLVPPLPRRDRRPQRHARLMHDAGRAGHQGQDADAAPEAHPQRRHGALYLRPSARLPHLRRQRRLRTAGHGRRRRPARRALRLPGREPRLRCGGRPRKPAVLEEGHVEPVLHLRPIEVHRLQSLRPRLRRSAGHLRADDLRPRLR